MLIKYNDPRLERKIFLTPPPFVRRRRRTIPFAHTYLRSAMVPSVLLGKRVAVYNGFDFASFKVKKYMVGHKFGEFVVI